MAAAQVDSWQMRCRSIRVAAVQAAACRSIACLAPCMCVAPIERADIGAASAAGAAVLVRGGGLFA